MKPFYSKDINDVSGMLLEHINTSRVNSMIDLGCGVGDLHYILFQHKLLPENCVGIELRQETCQYLKEYIPSVKVICADLREVMSTIKETFDLVVCEQVIEHIEDDEGTLIMMHKLMHKNSKLFISSIIRHRNAWWFHRYKGEIRINPEHIREYESGPGFLNLLTRSGFKIIKFKTKKMPFILSHWIDTLLINLHLVGDQTLRHWYDRFSWLRALRKKLAFSIPGFYIIEVLAENNAKANENTIS